MAETPTTPEGTTPTPPAPTAPEYTYPNDEATPSYLRGRSASDAAQIVKKLVELATSNLEVAPATPAAPPAPNGHNGQNGTDAQYRQLTEQQARISYSLAQQQPQYRDVFTNATWKAEMDQMLQRVPLEQWTPDVIANAAVFVRGQHVEEIANERVRAATSAYGASPGGTLRSTGARGASMPQTPDNPIERVPQEWLKHAEQTGISDQEVAEFERANDMLPGEFFKQFGGRYITDAVADVNPGRRKA